MKGRRFNNFKKAVIRYKICVCEYMTFTEKLVRNFQNVNLESKDRVILELLYSIDEEVLYRNPEFNRQLRLRMKYHNLPWINKNG